MDDIIRTEKSQILGLDNRSIKVEIDLFCFSISCDLAVKRTY